MDWKNKRKSMDQSLKLKIVPILRNLGFKGSYPHFRRRDALKIDVLGFQFSQWGPQFYIEIAVCPLSGTTFGTAHYPPDTIKHYQCEKRMRIGDLPFDFENADCELVATRTLSFLDNAEKWWKITLP
jgi:hypothetical protein